MNDVVRKITGEVSEAGSSPQDEPQPGIRILTHRRPCCIQMPLAPELEN